MKTIQKIPQSELLDALATLEPGSPLHVDSQELQLEHVGFCVVGQIHNRTMKFPNRPKLTENRRENPSWNLKYSRPR